MPHLGFFLSLPTTERRNSFPTADVATVAAGSGLQLVRVMKEKSKDGGEQVVVAAAAAAAKEDESNGQANGYNKDEANGDANDERAGHDD